MKDGRWSSCPATIRAKSLPLRPPYKIWRRDLQARSLCTSLPDLRPLTAVSSASYSGGETSELAWSASNLREWHCSPGLVGERGWPAGASCGARPSKRPSVLDPRVLLGSRTHRLYWAELVTSSRLLPDNRVRLFLSGFGISSFISSDGLNFAQEAVTIPASVGTLVDDPEPIRLSDGTFVDITEVVPYL